MRSHRRFTLTELLMVGAVLIILLSLFVTGLTKMTRSANDTGCLNNLKQIGVLLSIYAEENFNYLPPGYEAVTNTNKTWSIFLGRSLLSDDWPELYYMMMDAAGTNRRENITALGGGMFFCPSKNISYPGPDQSSFSSYGIISSLSGSGAPVKWFDQPFINDPSVHKKIDHIHQDTVIVGDTANKYSNVINARGDVSANPAHPYYYGKPVPYVTDRYWTWVRHGNQASNFIHIDGSTKTYEWGELLYSNVSSKDDSLN